MRIQSLTGAWQFRQAGTEEWLPATVPGGVHTDLLAPGASRTPLWATMRNASSGWPKPTGNTATAFACAPELLDEEQVWLVCDGLDTLATVTLNGQELGRTDNMFRQYRWDVKPLAARRVGSRRQRIADHLRFAGAVTLRRKMAIRPLPGVPQAIPGGPYLRKALPVRLGLGTAAASHRHLERYPPGRVFRRRVSMKSTCASSTPTGR